MRRRDFITLLGGVAAAWQLGARAQQPTSAVVGYLYLGSPEPIEKQVAAFRRGLSETGFVEGRNLTIEYRWAHNDIKRLPDLAADLVRHQVAVIATPASYDTALAAKAATSTTPIVFSGAADPVAAGLVQSLSRPGGNVTGLTSMNLELLGKRFGLLHELLPNATRLAIVGGGRTAGMVDEANTANARAAALAVGASVEFVNASNSREIEAAFAILRQMQIDALVLGAGPLIIGRRVQLATLAVHYKLPVIYGARENVEAGGLISYGTNLTDQVRQVGIYTGRILKGEKPADLPVVRAAAFELVINLQTVRLLGIDVPPTLLAIADEVIE
jgi:putative ABC transport system substrate-binding protein